MLPAKLQSLSAAARRAARRWKQALGELAEQVAREQPEPALARIPVPVRKPPVFANPYRRFLTQARAVKSIQLPLRGPSGPRPQLAHNIWTHLLFRAAGQQRALGFANRGFSHGLGLHLPNAQARMFSTYAALPQHLAEAVRNLTTAIRTLFNAGEKASRLGTTGAGQGMAHAASTRPPVRTGMSLLHPQARETIVLAQAGAGGVESTGCRVEFSFKPVMATPHTLFLDDNVTASLTADVEACRAELAVVARELKLLLELGLLPVEVDRARECIVVHFANTDAEHVARMLLDLGITRGVVREVESEAAAAEWGLEWSECSVSVPLDALPSLQLDTASVSSGSSVPPFFSPVLLVLLPHTTNEPYVVFASSLVVSA